jgi:hypothetical protein
VRLPVGNNHTDRPKSHCRIGLVRHKAHWFVLCQFENSAGPKQLGISKIPHMQPQTTKRHKSQQTHSTITTIITTSRLSSVMVNKNITFRPLSAEEREKKTGLVFTWENVRCVSIYPQDHYICPWCGTTSKNPPAMAKHWLNCPSYKKDHPPPEQQPFAVLQHTVQPLQVAPHKKAAETDSGSTAKKTTTVSWIFRSLDIWIFGYFEFWMCFLTSLHLSSCYFDSNLCHRPWITTVALNTVPSLMMILAVTLRLSPDSRKEMMTGNLRPKATPKATPKAKARPL